MTPLASNVTCLQESQNKLMPENNTFIILNADLLSISNQAAPCNFPAKHEKIVTSFSDNSWALLLREIQTLHPGSSDKSESSKVLQSTASETVEVVLNSCSTTKRS